jgi:hypothetical protein
MYVIYNFSISIPVSGYPSFSSFPVYKNQHIQSHPVGSELITKITIIFQIKPFLHELLPPEVLFSKHVPQPPKDIIGIGKDKQGENDYHSYNLGVFQELFAWLAAGYHLIQQEGHMAAIERRYRKYIHKGKDKGKKTGDLPK